MNSFFKNVFSSIFQLKKISCTNLEEVEMNNPAFAQMDPHLQVEDEESEQINPFGSKHNKPPSFDSFFNNIHAVTKKLEHIKGFRFEISGAVSNNFHISHSWSIQNKSGGKKMDSRNPFGGGGAGPKTSYTLSTQYLGGNLRTFMDQPNIILTGRMESSGKLEAAIIKKLNDRLTLRLNGMYPNSDINYSQMTLDLDIDG